MAVSVEQVAAQMVQLDANMVELRGTVAQQATTITTLTERLRKAELAVAETEDQLLRAGRRGIGARDGDDPAEGRDLADKK